MYDSDIEIRKLPADALCKVIDVLEINNDWKKVMSVIPRSIQSKEFEPKYNNEQVKMIEEYAKATNLKSTEILFDEWGTSGRVRPTLGILKDILIKAQIFRAADEIANMLNETLPERPSYGPAAPVTMNITEMLNEDTFEKTSTNGSFRKSSIDRMCNGSTKQMMSLSDMIEFSDSIEGPVKSLPESLGNKTTAKMQSSDNLMQFPDNQPTEKSMNVPDLSAMLGQSKDISKNFHAPIESSTHDGNLQYPVAYQESFPNITITTHYNITTGIDSAILQDTNLIHFDYNELKQITGNFSESLCDEPNGLKGRIGSGGFGDVFVGSNFKYGLLAVKKAHSHLAIHRKPDIAIRIFNAEVKYLSQFRHNNIVPILGFSINGSSPCVVCEYIEGGSLQQNIDAKILNEPQRIDIMIGAAEGLRYLHTSDQSSQIERNSTILQIVGEVDSQNSTKYFVHGDVKTANILLTKDFVPKLCDFGLAKQYDSTFVTTCPMGTSAYMAPEGIHGTITQKIDIFSFGIVILELLTGLKPIVVNDGENINIKHYVEENAVNNKITTLLDPVVENWRKADNIYDLARQCLHYHRKNRPTITEVCDILGRIKNE